MLPKIIVVLFLLAILVALFSGAVFLLKDTSDKRRTLRSLTWRVILQLSLLLFLVAAYYFGWIHPHGVGG